MQKARGNGYIFVRLVFSIRGYVNGAAAFVLILSLLLNQRYTA